ncbi:hypothetical protein LRS10_05925 [Phenylobacterium sp. J426]|uniref:hypothetical protein n=1 Tax=Phenylobacterium sp. J426 TaxID=2898439 RepID=UPI002151920E|nr:hypothetical protein [Phenylobacterium sp. J426]MCR5873754.1 hypothetical protein [Phenylobacterium sp. J426]
MAYDQFEDEVQTGPARRAGGGGRLVVAGVVSACALGVGFGLWARPSAAERGDAPLPPKPELEIEAPNRKLQIVLDDSPAPMGPLLDVMPSYDAGTHAPAPAPELLAPKGPRAGLMKVDAVAVPVAAAPAVIPAVVPPRSEPAAAKAEAPKPAAAKVEKRKAERKPAGDPAKAAAAKSSEVRKVAKTEKVQPKKAASATASRAREVKVAKAQAKTQKAEPRAQKADPNKLSKLTKAVQTAPKTIKAKAEVAERKARRELELAEGKRAERAKAKKLAEPKAKGAAAKAKPQVEKAAAPKKQVTPRGEGPMRVARNNARPAGCASADPGEALVCADPRLTQRDRQLQRAFRNAEAAGVPASALQRQQERWRQARAAAARDGSWAVEDVYEARIAELNDLARDARDD